MKMYLYITIWVLALMIVCNLGRFIYYKGYNAGREAVPEVKIDETKAYDLGWMEGRSIQNFIPIPTKWVEESEGWRIEPKGFDELQVLGIVTTSPRSPNDRKNCVVWECLEEDERPHVLKHYSYAIDEMPSGKTHYYWIGVWDCPNPLEKINENLPER